MNDLNIIFTHDILLIKRAVEEIDCERLGKSCDVIGAMFFRKMTHRSLLKNVKCII